jgi:hypothetical protein
MAILPVYRNVTSHRLAFLIALSSSACFSPAKLNGHDGPATSNDSSGGASGSGDSGSGTLPGSESGGDGCVQDGECLDDNPCSDDRCESGTCVHPPVTDDPACVCSGPGDCTQLPPDDDCATRACDDGICAQHFVDAGVAVGEAGQTTEDCKQVVCDGRGGTEVVDDDSDVPNDGLECTEDTCVAGMPSSTPVQPGMPCSAGECNDAGQCTGCTSPDECEGEQTFCEAITCESSVCGVMSTASNTPLPDGDQTTGDCLRRVCDGRGNVAQIAEDTDLPTDDGFECTDETCNDGMVGHPALPADTPCTAGFCDGNGGCGECNTDAQCPAAGQCTVGVCTDGVCSVGNADSGTACNDGLFCTQTDACNGAGACVGSGSPCPGADGDSDCSESCNEGADACTGNDAAGSGCSDGLFCTQTDTCNGAGTCVGSGNPCPGADGDGDCSESCNEVSDACNGNDPGGTDCGGCHFCNNGSCVSECGVGEKCCIGDDLCIPTNQSCP